MASNVSVTQKLDFGLSVLDRRRVLNKTLVYATGWFMETLNTALLDGSSKHGNTSRAWIGLKLLAKSKDLWIVDE